MSPLDGYLHILLVVGCILGAYFLWRVKGITRLLKFCATVLLIAFGLMVVIEMIFEICRFQLARGF
jgi:uncharacterized membrane protein